jgi:competence protein ComGC
MIRIRYAANPACRQGQWTLVGLLLTIAIITIVAAMYYPKIAAEHSQAGEALTPKERAYGAGCEVYTSQMNDAVSMYKSDHDDHPPTDVNQLKKYGVTDEMINAQGCSFQIDPSSGLVYDTGKGRVQPQAAGSKFGGGRRHHRGYGDNQQNSGTTPSDGSQPQPYAGYAPQQSSFPGSTPQNTPTDDGSGSGQRNSGSDDGTNVQTTPPIHVTIPTGGL